MTLAEYEKELRMVLKEISDLKAEYALTGPSLELRDFPAGAIRVKRDLDIWFADVYRSFERLHTYHKVGDTYSAIEGFRMRTADVPDALLRKVCAVLCIEEVLGA